MQVRERRPRRQVNSAALVALLTQLPDVFQGPQTHPDEAASRRPLRTRESEKFALGHSVALVAARLEERLQVGEKVLELRCREAAADVRRQPVHL